MKTQHNAGRLWLEWTLATLVGYGVGILVALPWTINFAYAGQPEMLIGLASGVVWGATVGIAQWQVLRRHARQIDGWWVLATLVGAMLGLGLGMALAEAVNLPSLMVAERGASAFVHALPIVLQTSLTGAVVGVVLGAAQWLVLRRAIHPAGWWIIASGLGWMIGMGLGAALADVITIIGALLVTGIASGVLTGLAMQQIVRQESVNSRAWA
jgi:hypothetical protein